MKKLKILYVVTEDEFFCLHRMALARATRDAGYDVHVAVRVSSLGETIKSEGFTLHPLQWMRRRDIGPLAQVRTLVELVRLYRSIQADIVHHVAAKPIIFGTIAAYLSNRPAILNMVTGLGYVFASGEIKARVLRPLVKMAFRFVLNGSRRLMTVENSDDKAFFIDSGLVIKDKIIHVPSSGVNTNFFHPVPEPSGIPVIMLVARMLWDKGVGDAVEAARLLQQAAVPFRLVLVGRPDPGNPRSIDESTLQAWHNEKIVEWWGHQSDMPAVWRHAHIALLPTLYREGVPVSLLEGGATSRPLVATDSPGCRDLIRNGENGYLVPPGDIKALANVLSTLLQKPELRLSMGTRARNIIEKEFSEDVVIDIILKIYDDLCLKR